MLVFLIRESSRLLSQKGPQDHEQNPSPLAFARPGYRQGFHNEFSIPLQVLQGLEDFSCSGLASSQLILGYRKAPLTASMSDCWRKQQVKSMRFDLHSFTQVVLDSG